jgi:hypothetical protein
MYFHPGVTTGREFKKKRVKLTYATERQSFNIFKKDN